MPLDLDGIRQDGYEDGWKAAIAAAARTAREYSNVKPGDICEVMAGDWQEGIAKRIETLKEEFR